MAGCSKKQYAIMMSAGPEGEKLASKMGSMEQEEFDQAFSELLGSGEGTKDTEESKGISYNRDEDEDYGEFDPDSDDDYGFDDEDESEDEDDFLDDEEDASIKFNEPTGNEEGISKELKDRGFEVIGINEQYRVIKFKNDKGETFVIGENDNYGWNVEKIDEKGRSEVILTDLNPNTDLDRLNDIKGKEDEKPVDEPTGRVEDLVDSELKKDGYSEEDLKKLTPAEYDFLAAHYERIGRIKPRRSEDSHSMRDYVYDINNRK